MFNKRAARVASDAILAVEDVTWRRKKDVADKDISVVVPFYNARHHLERCVVGLLRQNYPPSRYEIIMVDNNSTDHSTEIVQRYPEIRLLLEPKQGAYAARNRGVAAAEGRILAFTDADCVPAPDWLEKMDAALSLPGVEVAQGGRLFARDVPALSMLAAYETQRAAYIFSAPSVGIRSGYTNNMAVRRCAFDRCGPFQEVGRGADTLFVLRVMEEYASTDVVRYVGEARVRHLEITTVPRWLRKRFIYGQSFERHYPVRKRTHRDLTPAERSLILRRTVEANGYSRVDVLRLIALLYLGRYAFSAGRRSVRWRIGSRVK
jgi:glycosyltransferase involved in cell wall biosynthesis